jgi:hypothetical protein
MSLAARIALALLCWAAAAAAGWWWHHPGDAPKAASTLTAAVDTSAAIDEPPSPQAMAKRVATVDPMGLTRASSAGAVGAAASAPGSDNVTWVLAALVVRGAERYAVMTASGLAPLRLGVGDNLPDGGRIRAIHANRIEIRSPRGRPRTLYLIEP